MKVRTKILMSQRQFEDLYTPCNMRYSCGLVYFGGFVGRFWRTPTGKPEFDVVYGFDHLPNTIDVPEGCKTLATFKKKVRERIEKLVRDELFDQYCKYEKWDQMNKCLIDIMHVMEHAHCRYAHLSYDPDTDAEKFTEFQRDYHGIRSHHEYIMVRDENLDLLYVIDVSGTSVMYAIKQLMGLLADKY